MNGDVGRRNSSVKCVDPNPESKKRTQRTGCTLVSRLKPQDRNTGRDVGRGVERGESLTNTTQESTDVDPDVHGLCRTVPPSLEPVT